jgi:electron transfer flavoprotein beta subunit
MTIARIAVCIKHVPDGRLHIDPQSKRLDRGGPGEINKVDKNAIEEALRLKGAHNAEVVVVSMGPHEAKESLRTALALGADRALLVSDPAAEGSDLLATTRVLAAALEREEPDLVLFGQQTSDGGGAVLWAAVAERLGRPFASQAAELTVADEAVIVTRQTEFGDEVIEVPLPAVVSVSDSINEPRYTSLKGMMGAKKKPLEVLTLADVGLDDLQAGDAGAKTAVLGLADPPGRINSVRVKDEGNAARIIVGFLVEKQLA